MWMIVVLLILVVNIWMVWFDIVVLCVCVSNSEIEYVFFLVVYLVIYMCICFLLDFDVNNELIIFCLRKLNVL